MKRFYSPSADNGRGGWFDEARHGAKQVSVIDEEKQAALLARIRARDEAEYLAAVEANEDPKLIINPADFQRRQAEAINNPVMKIIDNPACTIPEDAFEVSDADYDALMEAQSAGRMIMIDPANDRSLVAAERLITDDQIMTRLRRRRNAALRNSDWTELPRVRLHEADIKRWEAYRDALRDLPAKAAAALKDGATADQIEEMFPTAPAD